MIVKLHIDELVLHGFDPRDRQRIADAVERELARLLGESNVAWRPAQTERLDAGRIDVPSRAGATQIGSGVARAIFGAVSRGEG